MTITVTRRGNVRAVNKEDMFAKFLLEKFNVVFEVTDINANDYLTRMNLMFAASEATDVSLAHRPVFNLNEWTESGYLRGFTQAEIQQKLPNFVAHYSRDAWPVVWQNIVHSDGKAYYLPSRRATNANMAWMYREDIFKEYGVTFPETTDELFNVLMVLKERTGKIPMVETNNDVIWAFTGLLQAYGMPELIANDISYINTKTGEFVPFAYTTDVFRRHTAYVNKLYKNDLIWKEFATATVEQRNKFMSQNNRFVFWGYPAQIESDYNVLSRTETPNASWTWAKVMLAENPQNGVFFKREPYYNADGLGFYAYADEKKVERFLQIVDWFHTEEGMVFRTYGIEGVHFTKQGSNNVFMPNMSSPVSPAGDRLENYGFITLGPEHPNLNAYYTPSILELENTFFNRDNYYFHNTPVQKFSSDETRELADLQVNLNQTRNEFYSRFIVGQLDINSDREWNNYIDTMKRMGLDRVIEIRTAAYNRSK
jgi:ABC-type glycerol-3-phosphate transport system substrate-binding protein